MQKAPRNKTITISDIQGDMYDCQLKRLTSPCDSDNLIDEIICGDIFDVSSFLPTDFVDLLILDPPYNLTKKFANGNFKKTSPKKYSAWFESWFKLLLPSLKKTATVYICCDWYSSQAIFEIISKYLNIRNRITWEREKGRGAKKNWKNSLEDIWFATVSDDYIFNSEAVKLKRQVKAPYKDNSGKPKDWKTESNGQFRLTGASNLWTDITIPFWSMAENTDHPTQKPEKLLAKLILASSNDGDIVLDPFAGSGSSLVTAKKLNRHYLGIELDKYYCRLCVKRLMMADCDKTIQGYSDNIFWERNTIKKTRTNPTS